MPTTGSMRALALAAATFCAGGAAQAQAPLRIGVVEDLSGMYAGNGGPNMVLATQMAVEDFGGKVLGRPIEVLAVDHQNKPDVGSTLARQLVDEKKAAMLVLGGSSSVGLAVQSYAKDRKVTTVVTGGYAPQFSGVNCSPYGSHWVPSTGELAKALVDGVIQSGGKNWYFITADYVFGNSLSADASKAIKAAGGRVVGEVKHPLGTTDMSSPLLQAQSSGAQVIGLANAGPDLVNTIKQVQEFGVTTPVVSFLLFANNTVALGLPAAQGLRAPVSFYWDRNAASRAWGERFMARNKGQVPTMGHAAAYVSTTHYLKAVAKAGTDEAGAVDKAMKEIPIEGGLIDNPKMLANGRVTMDLFIIQVKTPKASKGPADIYDVRETLPADTLFPPADKSGCPLTQG